MANLTPKQRAILMAEGGLSEGVIAGILGIDLTDVNKLMVEANPNVALGTDAVAPGRFRVRKDPAAADQSLLTNAWTLVTWEFEDVDTDGWFDLANERFLPLRAGSFIVSCLLNFASPTAATHGLQLRKNGVTDDDESYNHFSDASVIGIGMAVTGMFDLNGTTDYVDVAAYQNTGVAKTLQDAQGTNQFFGYGPL